MTPTLTLVTDDPLASDCQADDPTWLTRREAAATSVADAQRAIDSGDPDGAVARHLRAALAALEVA